MTMTDHIARVKFLLNPLRSGQALLPRFIADTPLWSRFWTGCDGPRQRYFEFKNRLYQDMFLNDPPPLSPRLQEILDTVKREGICVVKDMWNPTELEGVQERIRAYFRTRKGVRFDVNNKSDVRNADVKENKPYLVSLTAADLEVHCPLVRQMVRNEFVEVAGGYLGIYPFLRSISAWLNFPTDLPECKSQLWHWDASDFRMLKVFTYLTDVGEENGPFTYLPGTHFQGYNRHLVARMKERFSSEDMAKRVGRDQWKVCTAAAGTVIFADTTGFHRGGRCEQNDRILVQAEFTGHHPWSAFLKEHKHSHHKFKNLNRLQQVALYHQH